MPSSAVILLIFGVLATPAAGVGPTRCIGGGNRLTFCVETPPAQLRRYDNGGLYGPEYFRRKYGGGRAVLAPPPDYAVRYDYGAQTRPLYGSAVSVYRPAPTVIRPIQPIGPIQPVIRPIQPVVRPIQPVVRPIQPVVPPIQPVVRPIQPVVRPVPPPVFRPSPPIAVDYGLQRRSGYAVPSVYGGRAGYAGGFRPSVVAPQPYPAAAQPRPAPTQGRPFIVRPHVSGPHFSPHVDIRSFYSGASMLGRGQVSTDGRNNVQFVCDFSLVGVSPATDVLTDVVWQKVGRPAYMNNPMTSATTYPNLLRCPNTYVSSTPTNYGFTIAGSKTTLVIKNATSADHGMYRCYATRVSRLNPRQRVPVYMEVYYAPSATAGRR